MRSRLWRFASWSISSSWLLLLAVTGCVLIAAPHGARGDGLIVIHDPPAPRPGHFAFAPLEVVYHRVSVEIKDRVAVTSVDQEFYNPNAQQMEGTYLFPLPAGAHIDAFSMDVNGRMTEAELLDAEKARSIYESIVRRHRDPALLEYVGRGVVKARIFPIEPHARKQVKLKYTELLNEDAGLAEYTYSLNTEKFSAAPLKEVSIQVNLACEQPIKSIYSPSHDVEIRRDGDRRAVVGYEARDIRPDTDFKLIFSCAQKEIGLDVLTYRNGVDDGYFMLLASPGHEEAKEKIQSKDICFVIDTSGSMAGPKLEQAKKALLFCLSNLNAGDRFDIIRFSTDAEPLFDQLVSADEEHLTKARSFVEGFKPIGGTAIHDALKEALNMPMADAQPRAENRPYVVIFLTDGQPTIGETDEDKIVEGLLAQTANISNPARTRVFCFGIGTDINTQLLDRVSNETKAFSQYVLPEEDIEVKVSSFYTKIQSPVLTEVKLDFGADARVTQIYPPVMPDLFHGETLIVFGRYGFAAGAEHRSIPFRITGTINGEKREFSKEFNVAMNDVTQDFIPRLWATRRVGWLLDEIRLRGESEELKDEVVKLAREHGIVTPYTAYLIVEDEDIRNVPAASRTLQEFQQDQQSLQSSQRVYEGARAGQRQVKAGREAVVNSQAANRMKVAAAESELRDDHAANRMSRAPAIAGVAVPTTQPGEHAGYRVVTDYKQQVRVVNGKAFYQNNARWTDADAQVKADVPRQQIRFNSDEYFALLNRHPRIAPWLSLGTEIDVVIDNVVYEIR